MESAKIKQGIGGRIADVAIYVVCGLFMLLCIYPFYYVIIYSISDPNQASSGLLFLPKGYSMETFKGIFRLNDIPRA